MFDSLNDGVLSQPLECRTTEERQPASLWPAPDQHAGLHHLNVQRAEDYPTGKIDYEHSLRQVDKQLTGLPNAIALNPLKSWSG